MSLRRQVMRNKARNTADKYRAATSNNRTQGVRRDKRIVMRAEFANLGPPSVRDGSLRIYGQRLDYFKDRAYRFMLGDFVENNKARASLGMKPRKRFFHRPWAGSLL